MSRRGAIAIATAAGALSAMVACDPNATVTTDDVIVGLTASPGSLLADGTSMAVVEVQSVPDHVKDGLSVHLAAINATWTGVTGASQDLALGPDGATTARLTASRVPGEATVVAEIAGYQKVLAIPLTAATIPSLTRVLSGRLTAGMASMVQITVTPQAEGGGLPSAGTTVDFAVTATPAGSAYPTTPRVVLDAAGTTATSTVMASASATQVDLTISITPPGAGAPTATDSVRLAP